MMITKKALFWVLALSMASMLSSCDLENDSASFHFVNLQVTDATLPDSFQLYETYEIYVTYLRPNGCTYFEGFDITKDQDNARNVVVIGSEFNNISCTQLSEQLSASFTFTCYYEGSYKFRFWSGEDENGIAEFIEYEVPVAP